MLPADSILDVVTVLFNPRRFQSHLANQRRFIQHMLDSPEVRLTTIEVLYKSREPMLQSVGPRHTHLVVQGNSELWVKENALNLAVRSLPWDWRKVAIIDGDVTFQRPDWAQETLQALEHHAWVQPWSDCLDLGPNQEVVQHHRSFCRQYVLGEKIRAVAYEGITFPHPGYAHAMTREAWNALGGLIEIGACGSGDHHMMLALLGLAEHSLPKGLQPSYRREVLAWQRRAERLHRNLGYVEGTLTHTWHGMKTGKHGRGYIERWAILIDHKFDPDHDLVRNSFGIFELPPERIGLRDALRGYFRNRLDDLNAVV